jgi:hypothetical protein
MLLRDGVNCFLGLVKELSQRHVDARLAHGRCGVRWDIQGGRNPRQAQHVPRSRFPRVGRKRLTRREVGQCLTESPEYVFIKLGNVRVEYRTCASSMRA